MTESAINLSELDDPGLVKLAQGGRRSAFSELAERYAARVYRTARHITKNDQDAEDVLQDAFLKAYSKLDQFQGDSLFSTWLTRIAVNEALMRLRKGKNRKTVSLDESIDTGDGEVTREVPDDRETPEEAVGRGEVRRLLETAVDSLSETYRPVFVLRDVEGFSTEETAEMLDLSISAVKSRLLRARLQLRDKLQRRLGNHGS